MQRSKLWFCAAAVLVLASRAFATDQRPSKADYRPPKQVKVLPLFFVPKGETPPTKLQMANLQKHMVWTQTRYKELLGKRDTFSLASDKPHVYRAEHDLAFYREQDEGAAPEIVDELLRRYKFNRYNCPFIFVAVLMNPKENYPPGGARPLNGGYNTGGGIVELSSHGLDNVPNLQCTLQHELGHAFGLPHVDCYGYDMDKNPSLMSYNPTHHTNGFKPSKTPGVFIAEDIRGLALNQRAFPRLRFNPKKDVPKAYRMQDIVGLGPMNIPGHPIVEPAKPTDAQGAVAK